MFNFKNNIKIKETTIFTPDVDTPFNALWCGEKEKDIIKIGKNTVLRTNQILIHYGTIIGENCKIGHNVFIREKTKIGDNTVIGTMTDIEGSCEIGNNVTLHSQVHICRHSKIEDYVFMAPFSILLNTKKIKHGRNYELKEIGPIIGYGSRIGASAVIGPGIKIARETLIGTGAVVTKNTDPKCIYYGNPAKFIREIPKDELLD